MLQRLSCAVLLFLACAASAASPEVPQAASVTLPVGVVRTDKWAVAHTTVTNPTDAPLQAVVATAFEASPNVQFAVDTWVAPRARRHVWQPLRAASLPPSASGSLGVETFTILLDARGASEQQWSRQPGLLPTEAAGFAGMHMSPDTLRSVAKVGFPTEVDLATWREVKKLVQLSDAQSATLKAVFGGDERREALAYSKWEERPGASGPADAIFQHVLELTLRRVGAMQPTILIAPSDDADTPLVVRAARRAARLPPGVTTHATGDLLPPVAAGLQGFSHIVLATPEPQMDGAQVEALRQWLASGGRFWVPLDRAGPSFLRRVLGDQCRLEIVDRVALEGPSLVDARTGADAKSSNPVEMLRVLAPGMTVIHTIDGWPASLRQRVGLGEIFLTTVEAPAWLNAESPRFAASCLAEFSSQFYGASPQPAVPHRALRDFAENEVGRPTVSRTTVLAVLAGLAGAMLVAGLLSGRRRRLEYAAIAAVALSLAATGTLVTLGLVTQQSVPLTVASVQLGEVQEDGRRLVARGDLVVYSPTADRGPLRATRGGTLWPDLSAQRGELVRMLWTDLDCWEWQRLNLPQGALLRATLGNVLELETPVQAKARLTAEGLRLTLLGHAAIGLEDMVLAGRGGRIAPVAEQNDQFLAGARQALPSTEYLAGYRDHLRAQRSLIHQRLLSGPDRRQIGDVPLLFAWTNRLDLGFALPQRQLARRRESTLLIIPVDIAHVGADEEVAIPSALIDYEALQESGAGAAKRYRPSVFFDVARAEWVTTSNPGTVLLRFWLPPQAMPLRMTEATLTLTADAVGRKLEVLASQGADRRILATYENMTRSAPQELQLRGEQLPTLASDGSLMLGLRVSSGARPNSMWSIRDIRLDVKGQGLEASGLSLPPRPLFPWAAPAETRSATTPAPVPVPR